MGGLSWYHWVIVIAIIALLFGGRGKLSSLMGDAARGIKEFKNGLKDDPHPDQGQPAGALPRQEAEKEDARVER